jgi:hypothetical protein
VAEAGRGVEFLKMNRQDNYSQILNLVANIDHHLTDGTRHFYRWSDGQLLITLDEVVQAILKNDLEQAEWEDTGA